MAKNTARGVLFLLRFRVYLTFGSNGTGASFFSRLFFSPPKKEMFVIHHGVISSEHLRTTPHLWQQISMSIQ